MKYFENVELLISFKLKVNLKDGKWLLRYYSKIPKTDIYYSHLIS